MVWVCTIRHVLQFDMVLGNIKENECKWFVVYYLKSSLECNYCFKSLKKLCSQKFVDNSSSTQGLTMWGFKSKKSHLSFKVLAYDTRTYKQKSQSIVRVAIGWCENHLATVNDSFMYRLRGIAGIVRSNSRELKLFVGTSFTRCTCIYAAVTTVTIIKRVICCLLRCKTDERCLFVSARSWVQDRGGAAGFTALKVHWLSAVSELGLNLLRKWLTLVDLCV